MISRDEARKEMRICLATYAGLILLLATTMAVSLVHLGSLNPILNLGVAAIKAGLIFWVFMHLREMPPLVRLVSVAALLWLGIMFTLGLADWLTRT
jgi:cytochrome c oxidase subunit 4